MHPQNEIRKNNTCFKAADIFQIIPGSALYICSLSRTKLYSKCFWTWKWWP